MAETDARAAPITQDVTVSQLLNRWLEHNTPIREPTTVSGYATHIKAIDRELGNVKLSRLTAQHLDRAYQHWRGGPAMAAPPPV